ncbi:VWA domain-containing protein [Flavobacterium sp.]|uniref:vWA domain-containing protein n=1 Tax=Flavobacterium sp. TaxID=239 RepID=UPI00286AC3C2|nr:VWA domain-containing protein [Flavobacterium sp.]
MMHFENHQYFYLLALLPLLLVCWIINRWYQQKVMHSIGDYHLIQQLISSSSLYLQVIKWLLLLLAFLSLLLILCKPYIDNNTTTTHNASATDVVFVVDVSQSMNVKDVPPDRISQVRNLMQKAMMRFTEEQVGVVLFAGKAGAYVPLTNDYDYINNSIPNISSDLMEQGTLLRESLKIAQLLFDTKAHRNKFIVLLSDGEFHDVRSFAVSDSIIKSGTTLLALGFGTSGGGEVPLDGEGNSNLMKRDNAGKPIHSFLHENTMKRIVGNHKLYQRVTNNTASVNWLFQKIHEKERTQIVRSRKPIWNYFLILALVFLILETLVPSIGLTSNKQQ